MELPVKFHYVKNSASGEPEDGGYLVSAVQRACSLLAAFRHEGEVLRLKDLASRTGLSHSTAFRILYTLLQGGLIERVGGKEYRSRIKPSQRSRYRLGYAHIARDSGFVQEWSDSIVRAAERERIDLVVLDHGRDSQAPLRNADTLIRERVDLVIDYLLDVHIASINASKFAEANIPVIAVGAPRPGAVYYGPNNYEAGLVGGRYLGRWAKQNWQGKADELLLMDIDIAGPLQALRMRGFEVGVKQVIPALENVGVVRLQSRAEFALSMKMVREHIRRSRARRILVGATFDPCALGTLCAFEEAGRSEDCAVVALGGCVEGRMELRRPGTRLVGDVAFFVDRYGEDIIHLALDVLEKRPVPSAVMAKHQLLTSKNVDNYYPNDCLLNIAAVENPWLRLRPIAG
jgi:ribose transport system substrate-binding protein